ncbi:hypothetical protein [Methylobacterium planeticum]|uniref:Uncharacterized protein n=1 Tax=Methylobacterium planeticum TaxID=2615211 RepID=A0A6N6MHA2_9HYPH|nr:hypothetical protein [Methylobacterium planeticum]KAB1069279.1 hypothetical protein F6X51_25745 [Methylobacterium planeticum]
MGPAEKAAADAAGVYLNQGVLGATCIVFILLFLGACWVARGLYNDLKACNAVTLADREKLITAIEGARDETEAVKEALQGIRLVLEGRGHAIGELSHQVDKAATEARHSLGNIASALDAIARRLMDWTGRGRDRDRDGGAP